jgi:hypothetical protein
MTGTILRGLDVRVAGLVLREDPVVHLLLEDIQSSTRQNKIDEKRLVIENNDGLTPLRSGTAHCARDCKSCNCSRPDSRPIDTFD